ncbi:MAG TPA: RebB family R body protein [Rhizomicrobium sp.]|nr:RebB family R body protein [Rhizomicrobium sp.]
MAYRTPVNSQITDAVTQSSVATLGQASAIAMGTIYQASAHSIGILFQNTTLAQKQAAMCGQAATNQGVMQMYSMNSMAAAAATAKIARSSTTDQLITALVLARLLK